MVLAPNLSGAAWSNFVYYYVLLRFRKVAILILSMGGHDIVTFSRISVTDKRWFLTLFDRELAERS